MTSLVKFGPQTGPRIALSLLDTDFLLAQSWTGASLSNYADIASALAVSHGVIVPAGTFTVAADVTIPKGGWLKMMPGAVLSVSAGVTLTINGLFDASQTRCFTGAGAVVGIRQVCPEWWGALGNGTGDDIVPMESAHTCVQGSMASDGGRPTIYLHSPLYQISRTWIVSPSANINLAVEGDGVIFSGSRIVASASFSGGGPVFQVSGQPAGIQQIADWRLANFAVVPSASGAGSATIGILIGNETSTNGLIGLQQNLVENVHVSGFASCWKLSNVRLVTLRRCSGWNDTLSVANFPLLITNPSGGLTSDMRFEDCQFVGSASTVANCGCVSISQTAAPFNPGTGQNAIAGLKFTGCDFYAGHRAFSIFAVNGGTIGDIWIDHCQFDQLVVNAMYIESQDSGTSITNIHINQTYFNAATGDTIFIASSGTFGAVTGVFVAFNWIYGAQFNAISINANPNAIRGVDFSHNTIVNANNKTGAAILFIDGEHFQCNHNHMERTDVTTFVDHMLEIRLGSKEFVAVGNCGAGCVATATVVDNSGSVTKYLAGNIP